MREIKFRARNADLPACWIYGYFVIEQGTCYIVNDGGRFKVIVGTECQYTGLLDKNGKEIYEGDVVKTVSREIKVVEYVTSLNMARYLPSHLQYAEVIGNIYETPNLVRP